MLTWGRGDNSCILISDNIKECDSAKTKVQKVKAYSLYHVLKGKPAKKSKFENFKLNRSHSIIKKCVLYVSYL